MGRWIRYFQVMKQEWRWWALVAATLLTTCALWMLHLRFQEQEPRQPFFAGNDFLLFGEGRAENSYISQWRWKEGRWDRLDHGYAAISENQQSLVLVDDDITLMQRRPPHARRKIASLTGISKRPLGALVALSDNQRFAAFLRTHDHLSTTTFRFVNRLQVVDLVEKKVIEERVTSNELLECGARPRFHIAPAASSSGHVDDPLPAGTWQLTEGGELRHIDEPPPELPPPLNVLVTRMSDGSWRALGEDEPYNTLPNVMGAPIAATSPDGKSIVAVDQETSRYFLIDAASKKTNLIDTPGTMAHFGIAAPSDNTMRATFSDDGKTLYLFGRLGYAAVVDTTTWKVVAEDKAWPYPIAKQCALVIAVAALGGIWFAAALRTASILWLTVACGLVGFFGQWVIYEFSLIGDQHYATWNHELETNIVSALFLGTVVGTMGALGWLWAWGQGWQHDRWAAGAIALGLSVIPIYVYGSTWLPRRLLTDSGLSLTQADIALTALQLVGAMTAVVAAVTSIPRWLGWKFASGDEEETSHFQLGEVFVVIAGIGIATALVNAAWANANEELQRRALAVAILTLVVTLMAGLLATFRWSWFVFSFLLAAIAAIVLIPGKTLLTDILWKNWVPFTPLQQNAIDLSFLMTAIGFAALPMISLRRQGWRWRRVATEATENDATSTSRAVV